MFSVLLIYRRRLSFPHTSALLGENKTASTTAKDNQRDSIKINRV
jgi:hypothetical protein